MNYYELAETIDSMDDFFRDRRILQKRMWHMK